MKPWNTPTKGLAWSGPRLLKGSEVTRERQDQPQNAGVADSKSQGKKDVEIEFIGKIVARPADTGHSN